ncbi:hypothetical protein CRYUN_Cryun37aG0109600 [Craigia yunnanensis]
MRMERHGKNVSIFVSIVAYNLQTVSRDKLKNEATYNKDKAVIKAMVIMENFLSCVVENDGLSECNEICYKDPVLKDQQWSAYIDRSPGAANYSEECFHACVAGCGYKFEMCKEKVDQVRPNRPLPPRPPPVEKPPNPPVTKPEPTEDVPNVNAIYPSNFVYDDAWKLVEI